MMSQLFCFAASGNAVSADVVAIFYSPAFFEFHFVASSNPEIMASAYYR
jgi:hypothetical protein